MKRDMRLYLQDIWESIAAIEEYTGALTEEDFLSNHQVQDIESNIAGNRRMYIREAAMPTG